MNTYDYILNAENCLEWLLGQAADPRLEPGFEPFKRSQKKSQTSPSVLGDQGLPALGLASSGHHRGAQVVYDPCPRRPLHAPATGTTPFATQTPPVVLAKSQPANWTTK